jgi:hypothetical protein
LRGGDEGGRWAKRRVNDSLSLTNSSTASVDASLNGLLAFSGA